MLGDGQYSARFWFGADECFGLIELSEGRLGGGDTVLSYFGTFAQDGRAFHGIISTGRHSSGPVPLFGLDRFDAEIVGTSQGETCIGTTTVEQLPGKVFSLTMTRIV